MSLVDHASVCTFDCPDTCSLTVTVEDGRIAKVRGSDAMPITDGVICTKVARDMTAFVHGPQRLLHPLRRTGAKGSGKFERISWTAALDEINARVSEVIDHWGPQAVAPFNYAGPHGLLAYDSMSLRFFHRLGASIVYRRGLCGGVRSEAWAGTYGAVPGVPLEFAENAKLNVVWGNNATVANLHLVRYVRRAKRKGGRLVVIDPLRTKIAEQADLHLAILPGTDVLLAWSLAAELERMDALDDAFITAHVLGFAEFMARARKWPAARAAAACGVLERQILTLAAWLAEADPLVLAPGNGLERGRNGGSGIRAAIALPALLGKFGQGSGIVLAAGNAFPKTPATLQRPDLAPSGTRTLDLVDFGRHLVEDDLDPPLRALFIYNHNPIVVHPDQNRMRRGLAREDIFSVGIEVAMTESMAHCDIVLPAATHFEYPDLYASYGHQWLQRAEPVIPPLGESLPNTEIFRRLAARFGFDEPCFKASDAELMDEAVDAFDPRLKGIRPSQISTVAALAMMAQDGEPPVLFENILPATPSGKVELKSEALATRWGSGALFPEWRERATEAAYPLMLISPASDKRISSTLGSIGASGKAPPLMMHPADAAARGLTSGDVKVWNERGEVILPLHVTEKVPPGVVASEKGAWLSTSRTGQTISALVSADTRADIALGACFNDTRVEVAAA
ncbi:MAG TPA: molybdopterin-dependent oxidoreductase [Stellaceae bacterium]|jgi:anaerobic selenocysteine-containing dehydrogenase|nr:molybdopterin-dependent oxidoreductase [Stellaceae bacterium]